MHIPNRLAYALTYPPLWIIQIGRHDILFSRVTTRGIQDQQSIPLEKYTLLNNKVANPSALCKSISDFCSHQKISQLRGWFLLSPDIFDTVEAHVIIQFLLSIKKTPIIAEKIFISPFQSPTLLQNLSPSLMIQENDLLTPFKKFNPIHPLWWTITTICFVLFTCITAYLSSALIDQHSPQAVPPHTPQNTASQKKSPTPRTTPLLQFKKIFTAISQAIPPTIVLDKIDAAAPSIQSDTKNLSLSIAGKTKSIVDLTVFSDKITKAIEKPLILSNLKEITPHKSHRNKSLHVPKTTTPTYGFTLTLPSASPRAKKAETTH